MPKRPVMWGSAAEAQERAELGLAELSLTYSVVINLMKGYLLSHHHLYADNLLSSISLASDLLHADTYFCGTIRLNRKDFPRTITNGKLTKGENIKWSVGDLMIRCRKDKWDVLFFHLNSSGNVMKPATRF